MPTQVKRSTSKSSDWPKQIKFGRQVVKVYRRKRHDNTWGYMIGNYSSGKRKLDSYLTEAKAIEAANILARRMSSMHVVAADMRNSEAASYAAAVEILKPHGIILAISC